MKNLKIYEDFQGMPSYKEDKPERTLAPHEILTQDFQIEENPELDYKVNFKNAEGKNVSFSVEVGSEIEEVSNTEGICTLNVMNPASDGKNYSATGEFVKGAKDIEYSLDKILIQEI